MIPLAPKLNLGRVWCDSWEFFFRNSEGEMVFNGTLWLLGWSLNSHSNTSVMMLLLLCDTLWLVTPHRKICYRQHRSFSVKGAQSRLLRDIPDRWSWSHLEMWCVLTGCGSQQIIFKLTLKMCRDLLNLSDTQCFINSTHVSLYCFKTYQNKKYYLAKSCCWLGITAALHSNHSHAWWFYFSCSEEEAMSQRQNKHKKVLYN